MFNRISVNDILKFLVVVTLCFSTILILVKCFVNPDAFEKLKEIVIALVVAFAGLVNRWSATDKDTPLYEPTTHKDTPLCEPQQETQKLLDK